MGRKSDLLNGAHQSPSQHSIEVALAAARLGLPCLNRPAFGPTKCARCGRSGVFCFGLGSPMVGLWYRGRTHRTLLVPPCLLSRLLLADESFSRSNNTRAHRASYESRGSCHWSPNGIGSGAKLQHKQTQAVGHIFLIANSQLFAH